MDLTKLYHVLASQVRQIDNIPQGLYWMLTEMANDAGTRQSSITEHSAQLGGILHFIQGELNGRQRKLAKQILSSISGEGTAISPEQQIHQQLVAILRLLKILDFKTVRTILAKLYSFFGLFPFASLLLLLLTACLEIAADQITILSIFHLKTPPYKATLHFLN
jgi:hypothetical protein